jgi:hypothetical protein
MRLAYLSFRLFQLEIEIASDAVPLAAIAGKGPRVTVTIHRPAALSTLPPNTTATSKDGGDIEMKKLREEGGGEPEVKADVKKKKEEKASLLNEDS